jgi:hypothetical protein
MWHAWQEASFNLVRAQEAASGSFRLPCRNALTGGILFPEDMKLKRFVEVTVGGIHWSPPYIQLRQ